MRVLLNNRPVEYEYEFNDERSGFEITEAWYIDAVAEQVLGEQLSILKEQEAEILYELFTEQIIEEAKEFLELSEDL